MGARLSAAPTLSEITGADPSSPALSMADGASARTWAELEARTNAAGHGAEAHGLSPGDHVAVVASNRVEFVEVLLGVQRAGMVVSPLKRTWTAAELTPVFEDARTKLVVTDTDAAREAAATVGAHVLDFDDGFDAWIEAQDAAPLPADRAGWRMSFTSGTTGRPKGVVRADHDRPWHESFAASGGYAALLHVDLGGPHLVVSPLFHGAPLTFALSLLARGVPLRVLPRWDPDLAMAALGDDVVSTCVVPTMFRQLLARRRESPAPPRALRTVLHGGEPCPPSLKRTMIDWWGPVFVEYFGFTEGGMTVATTEEWLARPGTVGRAMPYQEVRIIGEDGAVLGPRQEGRVYFANHGTTRPFVYLGDASKTDDSYVDGAYTAGDLGWLDEDGYLYLSGRSADVIVTGGVNVYPAEIEAVLAGVDGVDDVCVVAVPDEARGENVAAVVVPAVGADANAVTDAVRAAAEAELAGYKRPRAVIVRAALPRDATGKLLRRTLRDELWRDGDDRFVSPPAP